MRQEKISIFMFMMLISIIQSIQLISTTHEAYPNWPIPFQLLISIPTESSMSFLIIWYIGFVTVSFFVKGSIKDNIEGYGKYILVRNYNKFKFILRSLSSVSLWVLGLTIFQFLIFYLVSIFINLKTPYFYWDNTLLGKALPLYILTIICLVLLQIVLELYFSPVTALLVINCYVTLSITSWSYLSFINKGNVIIYFGIPNYMMALRTDTFVKGGLGINQDIALLIIGLMICIIPLMILRKIKKMDIY
ncbi:DUF2705 family protein [Peribacillus frigoritolerans]|uniref:DUF2705 family protein n=1 Tax=Peribacillus frigoritolerans TaxID=450367 RepID=UPI00227F66A5|nr:DUF2705 family protein [Peribacillus frigoritolerans]MCY8935673.1 DUF2705 family protein [Peribacillus frigoritolerans]